MTRISEYSAASANAAKDLLKQALIDHCQKLTYTEVQVATAMPPPVISRVRKGGDPRMSIEKMVQALRLLGHTVTITLDGVDLPAGE